MKQTDSRTTQHALKYIHEKYEFMLERGYEIISVEEIPAGWQATFRKQDLMVKIFRARGEDNVSFRTSAQSPDEFFDIGSVVHAAMKESIPLSAYDDLSSELQKYLDSIEAYFQGEPLKIQDSLRAAQQESDAALPPAGTAAPREAKRKPLLYHLLMGIVLLLLFGALTTLYMVLLDRLFSAFSLTADSHILFAGLGALLLATGTLLLFWSWRKRD